MPRERWRLQNALSQYIIATLTYMETVKGFYKMFVEWKSDRKKEYEKMMSIKTQVDELDPTFAKSENKGKDKSEGTWATIHKNINKIFHGENKLAKLENELAEVLEDTLGGLEELNTFLDAVEKLAVTSLHVFTENQIIYLPEKISFDDVQAVISSAQQICPLLLEFKRDPKTFFLPKLHNVGVLAIQLQHYIDTANRIHDEHGKSFNFEICLEMTEDVDMIPDLSKNDMQVMTNVIMQLHKIRMDEDFRMEFLFQDVSSAGFINIFNEQQPKLLQFLDEVEQCAVQLDKMSKGAKISSVAGSSVGATGSILSIVGFALIPVTAGVSVGLFIAGATMGIVSGANSLVTTLTKVRVDRHQQKKANEVFGNFMEDFQKVQDSLDEVINQPRNNLEPSSIDVVVGVVNSAKNIVSIGNNIDTVIKTTSSAAAALRSPDVIANTGIAVLQKGKAICSIPRVISDVPDVGQAAVKGPLALTKGARAGVIALNALFLGMDIFFIAKESPSLFKGSETKVSKFLRARAALFCSQMESWEKICNSLCQSKLTKEENKNILQMAFYPGN